VARPACHHDAAAHPAGEHADGRDVIRVLRVERHGGRD
jgi:hypothetical protein